MGSWVRTLRTDQRAQLAVALVALCVVGGAVAGWQWAKTEVVRRARAAGVAVERRDVSLHPAGRATLRNVAWSAGALAARVEVIEVDVALSTLLSHPEVRRVDLRGVEATYASSGSTSTGSSPSLGDSAGFIARVIDRLGGAPPEVVVERLVARATVDDEAAVVRLAQGTGRRTGDTWLFEGAIQFEGPEQEGITLPGEGIATLQLQHGGGTWAVGDVGVRFSEPATITHDGRTLRVQGAGLTGGGDAFATEVVVDTRRDDVAGPVRIARVEVGPLGAVARRELQQLAHVRAIGVDVTVARTPDSSTNAEEPTSAGWNERADALLSRAFAGAARAVERGAALGPARLELEQSVVRLPALDSALTLHRATLDYSGSTPSASATLVLRQGERDRGEFEVRYLPHESRAELIARDAQLSVLERLGKAPISGVLNGTLSVVRGSTPTGAAAYAIDGRAEVRALRFEKAVLADGPIEPIPFEVELVGRYVPHEAPGRVRPSDGVFETSRGRLRIGAVVLDVRPSIHGLQALPAALPTRAAVEFELAATPVQGIVEAIPGAILGPLAGAELAGTFGLSGRLELPFANPERLNWELDPQLEDFRIVSLPHDVDVRRLLTSATFTLTDEKIGHQRTVFVPAPRPGSPLAAEASSAWTGGEGCGSYVYVPLDQISPHLASGVFSTEDRGFLWHDGFNVHALRESLAANIAEGRIVRGGSTITMQLVKNLFLDRDRTVARKLREVFLVWLTESIVDVPKARLLELYFNVIEYGPGVRGIWHASTYFFGKPPRDLTVGEIAWFITTLTGPKIYHHQFVKRQISENVWGRMRERIAMLYHNDYITELDLVVATAQRPTFRPVDSACGPGSAAPAPTVSAELEAIAAELLRQRQAGVSREALTARLLGPGISFAGAPPPGRIDWDSLPLARDGHSWWRRR